MRGHEAGQDKRLIAGALLFALAGLAARAWNVMGAPLWLDEAYSAYAAAHDFDFLWRVVPRYETHPPFYYSFLHFWTLVAGDSLAALRLPGLIAGIVTPFVIAGAARVVAGLLEWDRSSSRLLVFVAFALACLSPPLVEMSREVRPYPLMILTYALLCRTLFVLRRHAVQGDALVGRAYVFYLIVQLLLLWLHNLGPLFALAGGLALIAAIIRRDMPRSDWMWLAGGHALIFALWLPALAILRDQAPTWITSTWLRFTWANVPDRLAVLYAVPGWQAIAAIVLIVLAAITLARSAPRLLAILLALTFIPTACAIGISATISPVFIMRTMTPVAVPAVLLLAIGACPGDRQRRLIGFGMAFILIANMAALNLQARRGPPFQNWYGTVDWLAKRFQPGDQIFAYPNEGALPLARALRDKHLDYPVRSIPAPVPAFGQGGWYPTGSRGVVSLPPARLHAIAQEPETEGVPTIWLLRLGAEVYDPGDVLLKELHRDRYIVRHWRDGPIDFIGLRRRDLYRQEPDQSPR